MIWLYIEGIPPPENIYAYIPRIVNPVQLRCQSGYSVPYFLQDEYCKEVIPT